MPVERTHPTLIISIAMMFSAPSMCLLRCLWRLIDVCMLHTIHMSIDMNPGIHCKPTKHFQAAWCLQVLLACVKCPGGDLLSHENILSIFQACFRIGHYQTERSKDMSGEGHHCEMLARNLLSGLLHDHSDSTPQVDIRCSNQACCAPCCWLVHPGLALLHRCPLHVSIRRVHRAEAKCVGVVCSAADAGVQAGHAGDGQHHSGPPAAGPHAAAARRWGRAQAAAVAAAGRRCPGRRPQRPGWAATAGRAACG